MTETQRHQSKATDSAPDCAEAERVRDSVLDLLQLLPDLAATLFEAAPHDCHRAAAAGGLTSRQMWAVIHLAHHRGITMSRLADGLGISPAAATELVARLEEKNVVRRDHDIADRRLVLVSLADRAEGYAESVMAVWRQRLQATLVQFPEIDPAVLVVFLRALIDQWKEAE